MSTAKKLWLTLLAVLVAGFLIPFVYHPAGVTKEGAGLPWDVVRQDDTIRVFSLVLGKSTLADVKAVMGDEPQMAIIAKGDEAGSLEAFFDSLTAGFVTGKMVLAADLPADQLQAMKKRAAKGEPQASGARRFSLSREDWQVASAAPVMSIAFIPTIRLEPDMVLARFGQPGEKVRTSETVEHYLYPEKGVEVVLDENGKSLIQYVQPSRFDLLKKPLLEKVPNEQTAGK